MSTVFIPAQLRELTGGVTELELSGATVRQLLTQLEDRFPGISARLCTGDALSPSLAVSIDGSISSKGLQAKVEGAREVHFLPAIGGG